MIKTIKAFAADIDMTLSAKGSPLPDITKEALQILREHGVLLGLATGRELNQRLFDQAKNWDLDYQFDFLIGMNGGQVWDRFHEDHWEMDLMKQDTMREMLYYLKPIIDEYEVSVNAEGGGNNNAMNIHGELISSMIRRGFKFDDVTGDIEAFCAKPCFKMLFRTTPEVEKMIRTSFLEKYGDQYQMIGSFPGTVEIMPKGIDKGTGLAHFAERNGIDLKDIITFGDNENDNPLLTASGWGVCLADGSAQTKAIADDITELGCLEGGVGDYLMKHVIRPNGWV
ncbi:MAG: HAD family hydrolase [Solobacterium sp.]|nr:HAD family hydrolase [Solobacterium sp.]